MNGTRYLEEAVDEVVEALERRDLKTARHRFDAALVDADPETVTTFLKALAATTVIPTETVVWGFGVDVFGNPRRDGYAWRCGSCPKVGVGYRTDRGARNAATGHSNEHTPALKVEAYGAYASIDALKS